MSRHNTTRIAALLAVIALLLPINGGGPQRAQAAPLNVPINHVIVVYQENWSFDSLYGLFPGANGIANAGPTTPQVDKDGKPITVSPQPWDSNLKPPGFDSRFPADLRVAPFN